MENGTILAVIGYILAIFFSLIGLIYGLILYFVKDDDEYVRKHAKYIIIISAIFLVIGFVVTMMFGFTALAIGASQ